METNHDARLREFGESYEDFEAEDICKLIVRAGERLSALCLDDNAVDSAMTCLHRALKLPDFPSDHGGDRSWRALWEATSSLSLLELPLAQRFISLNAYAYFGLPPTEDGQICTIEDVKSVIETVKAAVESNESERSTETEIDRTLLAAQGRFAIDEDAGVAPEQLAALARIGRKSMRNALAPSSGSGLELRDGMVTAASALKWLSARGDFKTSIWRDASEHEAAVPSVPPIEGRILWVPFARDNSEFHPATCQRGGKYQIGLKGSEKTVSDYIEALDDLARMRPGSYWRRPNTVGNWGIVTAVGFRPRTADELGLLPDQGGRK